jgi:hypothetical protein
VAMRSQSDSEMSLRRSIPWCAQALHFQLGYRNREKKEKKRKGVEEGGKEGGREGGRGRRENSKVNTGIQ